MLFYICEERPIPEDRLPKRLAIRANEVGVYDENFGITELSHWFTGDFEQLGEIEISGDAELLPDTFSVGLEEVYPFS